MKQHVKVVVRYCDGRIVKGTTLNFDPKRASFLLESADGGAAAEPQEIRIDDLKAIFFVRDLVGNSQYNEQKSFEKPPTGRRLAVTFTDGEQLIGASLTYDPTREGFFLFPADARSNNERIYIVRRSVAKVERL